ncbi:MAG: hypothetical protein ACI8UZ_002016, partial [Akkermansiaceae bacterium]
MSCFEGSTINLGSLSDTLLDQRTMILYQLSAPSTGLKNLWALL